MPSGMSNLTSSIRGATGNEKIKNLQAIEAQTASIAGVVVNSTSLIAGQSILVGGNDATKGIITIYGGTTKGGGEARFHTAADSDGSIEYFVVQAIEDDLQIGKSNGPASMLKLVSGGNVQVSLGKLHVGTQDQENGEVTVWGDGTGIVGGNMKLIVSNDWDSGIDQYQFKATRHNLTIGPNTDSDSLMYNGSSARWSFTNVAGVELGIGSSVIGLLNMHGNSSTGGGRINLHTGANVDATINQYVFKANNDDLEIGPSTNETALLYRGIDNRWVAGALFVAASGIVMSADTTYINLGATAGTNGYGLRDINGSVQFRHSGGTWSDIS